MMKPIETRYKGYRFRSRLEARWAVFFDALGVRWEYEKEGYDLDGVLYLPDFWLPELKCFIEIKGQEPTYTERCKCDLLSLLSGNPVYLFFGSIWVPGVDDLEDIESKSCSIIDGRRICGSSDCEIMSGYPCQQKKSAYGYKTQVSSLHVYDRNSVCQRENHCEQGHDRHHCNCPYSVVFEPAANFSKETLEAMAGEDTIDGSIILHPESGYYALARALCIANLAYSTTGDSCMLKRTSDNHLHLHRWSDKTSEYERIPLPAFMQQQESLFCELVSKYPIDWEWHAYTTCDLDRYRWQDSEESLKILSCAFSRRWDEWRDDSLRLIDAYAAARQARFEHGEHP